jgi:histone-lysine N-methyltransferase SETMAR
MSANPCIRRDPLHQEKKKHGRASPFWKQWWSSFIDLRGIVHIDWVPEGQTVNQVYYKEILTTLLERVWRKRPEIWKNGSRILHHDNTPALNAVSVKKFLEKHKISVLEHPPYSPDLAPCYIFLFPKIKSALKGTRFESVDAVKAKAMEVMNKLSENDLQHCFQKSKIRMERCRGRRWDHFEHDNNSVVWLVE